LRHGCASGLLASGLAFGWSIARYPTDERATGRTLRRVGMRAFPRSYTRHIDNAASVTAKLVCELGLVEGLCGRAVVDIRERLNTTC
jgi:hypothetical protein